MKYEISRSEMELRQKTIDSEAFARSAEEPNPNLRKSIRHSASAWTQTSRNSIGIVVRGYACDGGAFERRQHYRRRRKANSSPAIAVGTLRMRRATLRLCSCTKLENLREKPS